MKGDALDESALRYDKIVVMTDADVDGAHIRLLLLTFFHRYQPQLLSTGKVFIACPPLYKLTATTMSRDSKRKRGEEERYLFDQPAFDDAMAQLQIRMANDYAGEQDKVLSYQVQRFKGLGEMMPQQLWDTTMDPARRTLKQVTVNDGAQAEKMFSLCMGDAVDVRKQFILDNASRLRRENLDF